MSFFSYQEAKHWLESLRNKNDVFSDKKYQTLESVQKLLANCGNPDTTFKTRIIISGTAGKGTTASKTENILNQNNVSTLTLLSPAIQSPCEMIRLNGVDISPENFGKFAKKVKDLSEKTGIELSFHEIITVMGILFGEKNKAEVFIGEIGIGGAWDSVNAVQGPRISALTFVGNDHSAVLGDTLEKIAHIKSGIFTSDTFYAISAEKKFRPILTQSCLVPIIFCEEDNWSDVISEKISAKILKKEEVKKPSTKTNLPARFEFITHEKIREKNIQAQIVLDGSHAYERFQFLKNNITTHITGKKCGIIAMSQDHDYQSLKIILPLFDRVYFAPFSSPHRNFWSTHELHKYFPNSIELISMEQIWSIPELKEKDTTIIFTGSFYFCGNIREYFLSYV